MIAPPVGDATPLPLAQLHAFSAAVLEAAGMPAEHARWTADGLIWADAHGLPAHGVGSKLPQCVARIRAGGTNPAPLITAVCERPARAVLDADDAWGQVAGVEAMTRALAMAQEHGTGSVSVRRTSSAAALGYLADLAADRGCIGLAVTNGPPLVAAPGGTRRVVSNMGHALACPAGEGRRIIYDSATTTMSTGQMDLLAEAGESLPEGVLRDAAGRPTRDPGLWSTGLLEPIGAHRGFGLSIALEVLTGVLAGGDRFADRVGLPTAHGEPQGVSLFLLAIRPDDAQDLQARAAALVDLVAASGPEARVPGAHAFARAQRARTEGVALASDTCARLDGLAASLGVALRLLPDPPAAPRTSAGA